MNKNDDVEEKIDFGNFLVEQAPSSAYYIPDFITKLDEDELLKHIYDAPKPKWTQLSNRRLQNWGGLPHAKGMVAEKIPKWLDMHFQRLKELDIFDGKSPNHALVNEYLPGQGIMPHVDGPLFYPTITTINLGSHTLLDFYSPLKETESLRENQNNESTSWQARYIGSFFLEPRSLVCFKGDMYHNYLHGIEETSSDDLSRKRILNEKHIADRLITHCIDREKRVSVTIRHFPKTLKVKLNLGKR